MLTRLLDAFASSYLREVPAEDECKLTEWARNRLQQAFDEAAASRAETEAYYFFKDKQFEDKDFCYVTIIPKLKPDGLYMEVFTETGLKMHGIYECLERLTRHLTCYREKFERPPYIPKEYFED